MQTVRVLVMFLGLLEMGVGPIPVLGEETGDPLKPGKGLYQEQCARCHGVDGKGSGPDAKRLFPKPRDLNKGSYKFRSTQSGTPPTDEDLLLTISRGLPGSAMPAFEELTPEQRRQLVTYLKSLSPIFTEKAPQPVALAPDPGTGADLAKGKQLYKDLGCAACHGNTGRGSGPSAKALLDVQGNPIRATNLTQGWVYRGGNDPRSIALRLWTGVDGTPMPSYAEAFPPESPEDVWHLAYYVHSLQEESRWSTVVSARSATEPLPISVTDPRWDAEDATTVSLGSTVYKNGELVPTRVHSASVQALYDDQAIVLRVSWDDPTEDRGLIPDAFGLVLKPAGVGAEAGSLRTWPLRNSPMLDVIYWSADRPDVQEGVSIGFAPVATGAASVEKLAGEALYEDGRWSFLIRRPLARTIISDAVPLAREEKVPFAIAVWEGGNGEARKTRSSSAWLDLELR